MNNFSVKVSFIWSVADLLRDPYRPESVQGRHASHDGSASTRLRLGANQR